jgi:hypothetical protein
VCFDCRAGACFGRAAAVGGGRCYGFRGRSLATKRVVVLRVVVAVARWFEQSRKCHHGGLQIEGESHGLWECIRGRNRRDFGVNRMNGEQSRVISARGAEPLLMTLSRRRLSGSADARFRLDCPFSGLNDPILPECFQLLLFAININTQR